MTDSTPIRVAAAADIHCGRNCQGLFQSLFSNISEDADVLLLCGDLTDYGTPEEARVLAHEISRSTKIPIVAVMGNHDYEAGKQEEVQLILRDSGVRVLDGDTFEFRGIGFVGVKGFGGGFGRKMLEPWGEPIIKQYVSEAVNEALKLESGLAKLHSAQRIVLLHYAPIQDTVEGEPRETYPFLGSSRLEEPINRYGAVAVFHGHAHTGTLESHTREGIPVYNVAMHVLQQYYPDRPPYRVFPFSPKVEATREQNMAGEE